MSNTNVLEQRNGMVSAENEALVSIVIPCYRQAHFLPEAIESVLAQTHPRVEIVVVDDGSPDSAAEIAKRYRSVRCLRQENQGVSKARNAGFHASGGDYVIFLDADDRLTATAVELHLHCFAAHPKAGFVAGDIDQIASNGSYIGSPRWPLFESNHYEALLRVKHVANTVAVMFRRSTLETVGGFDTRCEPAEDYEILLRAARLLPSAQHRSIVAQYRRHEANTSRKGVTMLRAMRHVMQAQSRWVKGNPSLEAASRRGAIYWREHFGAVTVKEIYAYIRHRDLSRAARAFAALLSHVGSRLALLPWKHRRWLLRALRRNLGAVGTSRPNEQVVRVKSE